MLTVLQGDALAKLRELPDESVHCCVTSPPYWGLRDYGTAQWEGGDAECDHVERSMKGMAGVYANSQREGRTPPPDVQFAHECGKCGAKRIDSQLGLEKTPEEYVARMVEIFREVRRVLRKDGTLWLNLGDSYIGGGRGGPNGDQVGENTISGNAHAAGTRWGKPTGRIDGLKPKDLCGIPWRVAFALQADGWWLRQDIIWAKPNPMPESVTDRCTKAHEYLFLLTKSARYFYDAEAIKEQSETPMDSKARCGFGSLNGKCDTMEYSHSNETGKRWKKEPNRNKRSVWTVSTAPYPEAHFATYPPDLIKPCILAGTSAKGCCAKCGAPWERVVETTDSPTRVVKTNGPYGEHGFMGGNRRDIPKEIKTTGWRRCCECYGKCKLQYVIPECGGADRVIAPDENGLDLTKPPIPCTILDPFAGSGTTGAVALELGRKAILIELGPKYVEMIEQRCNITPGLALA